MQKERFSTLDIHLAAFLEFHGVKANLEKNGGTRVIFTFPQGDEVYRLLAAFNRDDTVPAASYVSALRSLKARMFSMRAR